MPSSITRRRLIASSLSLSAGLALPGIVGRAQAAVTKLKLSSSWADDAKYAAGTVFYNNLVNQLKAAGLDSEIEISFFPNNQLGQEIVACWPARR